jgi:hypothetical protein
VEYMVKDDEGHRFVNDENVIDLHGRPNAPGRHPLQGADQDVVRDS